MLPLEEIIVIVFWKQRDKTYEEKHQLYHRKCGRQPPTGANIGLFVNEGSFQLLQECSWQYRQMLFVWFFTRCAMGSSEFVHKKPDIGPCLVSVFRFFDDTIDLHMFYDSVSRKRCLFFLFRRAFLQTAVKEINRLVFSKKWVIIFETPCIYKSLITGRQIDFINTF